MSRPLRIAMSGGWYHLTARGNEQREIFRDDKDRLRFLALLGSWVEQFRIRLHAYVLMSNHYHLLAETLDSNLSEAMQWINVSYSQGFNRRHQRVGHLFQGRFKGILVDERQWGLELSRYLHLNPVRVKDYELSKRDRQRHRAGAGKATGPDLHGARIQALREYRWSSYRAYIGKEKRPAWLVDEELLRRLGGLRNQWQKQYQGFVEQALWEGVATPWEQVQGQVVLGNQEFLEALEGEIQGDPREQPGLRKLVSRPDWKQIVKVVEELKQEKWEQFRDRRGDWGRDVALYLGRKQGGLKLKQLGQLLGIDYSSVGIAVRRLELRCKHDDRLTRHLRQAELLLSNVET